VKGETNHQVRVAGVVLDQASAEDNHPSLLGINGRVVDFLEIYGDETELALEETLERDLNERSDPYPQRCPPPARGYGTSESRACLQGSRQ